MTPGPLTRLRDLLAAGELCAAVAVLERTRWTNLCNVLRTLPAPARTTAYRLLNDQLAADVARQLVTGERETFHRVRRGRRGTAQ